MHMMLMGKKIKFKVLLNPVWRGENSYILTTKQAQETELER